MSILAQLRNVVDTLRDASHLDEDDVTVGLRLCKELVCLLHAHAPPAPLELCDLPHELLTRIAVHLPSVEAIARLSCTSRVFHGQKPAPPPRSVVEESLRERAARRGATVPLTSELAPGETVVQALYWGERRDRLAQQPKLAPGLNHHAFIDAGGRLLTCGQDADRHCFLGHGEEVWAVPLPTPVPGLESVRFRSVSLGDYHSLAVGESGCVFSWGCGEQLGHGDPEALRPTPRAVESLRGVRVGAISAGGRHSLAVDEEGVVFSFGHGVSGRLGHNSEEPVALPRAVEGLSGVRVRAVSAGGAHSLALSDTGVAYSFGDGACGQLGHGERTSLLAPRAIEGLKRMRVLEVSAGGRHSLALSDEGVVFSFGRGVGGRLGHGEEEHQLAPRKVAALHSVRARAVCAGGAHSLALCDEPPGRAPSVGGTVVFSFGIGSDGRLGHGDEENQLFPRPIEVLRGKRVHTITAGGVTSLAETASGHIYGWGDSSREVSLGIGRFEEPEEGSLLVPRRLVGLRSAPVCV